MVATFSCFRFTPGLAFGEEEQTEPVNVVEQTDEEDSERESEMSSSECEMSEEETLRSINRV
jgi:hypothetical protein